MKKFLSLLALVSFALIARPAELTVNLGSATNTVLLTGAAAIYSVKVVSTNAANVTLKFYDTATAGAAGMSNYFAAHTNITKAITSVTNVYTTEEGASITNVYPAMATTSVAVPAAWSNKTPIKTLTAIAAATVEEIVARQVVRGLSAYAASPLTITVEYEQSNSL